MKPFCRNLNKHAKKIHSQGGEDGIISAIFKKIRTTNRFFVEFGSTIKIDNTRYLRKIKWNGININSYFPTHPNGSIIKKEWITAENVNEIFKKYHVPLSFDLLSIDVDGNDYWIWKSIKYDPRVVIIEFNSFLGPTEFKTIKYDPNFSISSKSHYFGASIAALRLLGKNKGYSLINQTNNRNAFFIKTSLLHPKDRDIPLEFFFSKAVKNRKRKYNSEEWIDIRK